MSEVMQEEKRGFEAEISNLMHLVVNALYSNKEIFLRELVSNASDAMDKLRFRALSDKNAYEGDADLKIQISIDKDAKTITISDNGIGMSRDEIIAHLGTIAKSGTKEFLSKLTGDQQKDAQLIGQFGVGFYSAFIVADHVTVYSRAAGLPASEGVMWQSRGESEYTISKIQKSTRGTEIVLHLKKEEEGFLDTWRLKSILNKYSDHISVPIMMLKEKTPAAEGEENKDTDNTPEWETVNQSKALWTQPKKDIQDSDYIEFYKHISHDYADPLAWSLNQVESAKLNYISLLYIPSHPPFDLWMRDTKRGVKLFVKRVFIMDDAEQFLPNYLRFMRGLVDSSDLPLNISREILQSNSVIESMKSGLTKRALGMIEKMSEDKDKYATFWQSFGAVLKEGPVEDPTNREQIAKLLRFSSTHTNQEKQDVSLDDYIARMKPKQEVIYYLIADGFAAAKDSPHLEMFRKHGIEVLLLWDRVDEWLMGYLLEFNGKKFQSIARGDLDISQLKSVGDDTTAEKEDEPTADQQSNLEKVIAHMKEILGDEVKNVRLSHRLTTSPSCVVADDQDMTAHMQRLLQAAGQQAPASKPILEINPKHRLVLALIDEADDARFGEWTRLLLEQAQLSDGAQLANPVAFVQRLNKLLEQ